MVILIHALVAAAYFVLALAGFRGASLLGASTNVRRSESFAAKQLPRGERIALLVVWMLHGMLLYISVFRLGGVQFGFAAALSTTMWLAVAVFWVESLYFNLVSMRLLALPMASVAVLLPLWFPGGFMPRPSGNPAFELHLVVAMSAYGLLTIAALHALLMAALDRRLHGSPSAQSAEGGALRRFGFRLREVTLAQLPPLMTMERLLFRTLGAGFVLLTLTLISGFLFSDFLFGRALRLEHKTFFALVSWVIFAALLAGRAIYGWRGRTALRWTLAGFSAMLLAYVGSRFVLEVILHRL